MIQHYCSVMSPLEHTQYFHTGATKNWIYGYKLQLDPPFFKHTSRSLVLSSVTLWWKQWKWATTNRKNLTVNREWTALTKQEKPTKVEKKKGSGLAGRHVGAKGGGEWKRQMWGSCELCHSSDFVHWDSHGVWVSMCCRVWQRETQSPTSVKRICQHKHPSKAYYNTLCVNEV